MVNPAPVEADKELSLYCKVIFRGGEPILIEKLDPFIPEIIDIQALVDKACRAARIDELETLEILDFEPDEPEIEAKYPTMNLDEYLEDRLSKLKAIMEIKEL